MGQIPQNAALAFLVGLVVLTSIASAWWVYRDARARFGRRGEAWPWAVGTVPLLWVVLPVYLLFVRPPGVLVRCPSCGRSTLSHRATCQHCEHPIPFESQPAMWGVGEMVGIALVFGLTLPLLFSFLGIGAAPDLAVFSAYAIVQSILLATLSLYVARRRYRQPLQLLGLRGDRAPALAAAGVLVGGAMVLLSAGLEEVSIALVGAVIGRDEARRLAEAEHMRNPVTEVLLSGVATAELAWILLLLCVVVPVAEEIFFRGFVYRGLRGRWSVYIAAVASAAFFGIVHLEIVHFLPIFILGLVLAYSLERTGSLLPAIVIHAVNNVVAVFGTLYRWDI